MELPLCRERSLRLLGASVGATEGVPAHWSPTNTSLPRAPHRGRQAAVPKLRLIPVDLGRTRAPNQELLPITGRTAKSAAGGVGSEDTTGSDAVTHQRSSALGVEKRTYWHKTAFARGRETPGGPGQLHLPPGARKQCPRLESFHPGPNKHPTGNSTSRPRFRPFLRGQIDAPLMPKERVAERRKRGVSYFGRRIRYIFGGKTHWRHHRSWPHHCRRVPRATNFKPRPPPRNRHTF